MCFTNVNEAGISDVNKTYQRYYLYQGYISDVNKTYQRYYLYQGYISDVNKTSHYFTHRNQRC